MDGANNSKYKVNIFLRLFFKTGLFSKGFLRMDKVSLYCTFFRFLAHYAQGRYLDKYIFTRTGDLTTASLGNKLKRTSFSQEHSPGSKNLFFWRRALLWYERTN